MRQHLVPEHRLITREKRNGGAFGRHFSHSAFHRIYHLRLPDRLRRPA